MYFELKKMFKECAEKENVGPAALNLLIDSRFKIQSNRIAPSQHFVFRIEFMVLKRS